MVETADNESAGIDRIFTRDILTVVLALLSVLCGYLLARVYEFLCGTGEDLLGSVFDLSRAGNLNLLVAALSAAVSLALFVIFVTESSRPSRRLVPNLRSLVSLVFLPSAVFLLSVVLLVSGGVRAGEDVVNTTTVLYLQVLVLVLSISLAYRYRVPEGGYTATATVWWFLIPVVAVGVSVSYWNSFGIPVHPLVSVAGLVFISLSLLSRLRDAYYILGGSASSLGILDTDRRVNPVEGFVSGVCYYFILSGVIAVHLSLTSVFTHVPSKLGLLNGYGVGSGDLGMGIVYLPVLVGGSVIDSHTAVDLSGAVTEFVDVFLFRAGTVEDVGVTSVPETSGELDGFLISLVLVLVVLPISVYLTHLLYQIVGASVSYVQTLVTG